MKSQVTISVKITSFREKVSQGEVEQKIWDKRERTMRGLKALGVSWGLAVFAVVIPILHFVLVPLLLVIGPFAFYYVAGQKEIILGGKGLCPECEREFEIVRSTAKWPLSDLCNHCHAQLKIESKGSRNILINVPGS